MVNLLMSILLQKWLKLPAAMGVHFLFFFSLFPFEIQIIIKIDDFFGSGAQGTPYGVEI